MENVFAKSSCKAQTCRGSRPLCLCSYCCLRDPDPGDPGEDHEGAVSTVFCGSRKVVTPELGITVEVT